MLTIQQIRQFEEHMDEIRNSVREAFEIVKDNVDHKTKQGRDILERARLYWFPQIEGTVDGQSSMCGMNETLQELVDDQELEEDEIPEDLKTDR